MIDTSILFEPLAIGNITMKNRLAMGPMTRQGSYLDGTPTDLNVEHYREARFRRADHHRRYCSIRNGNRLFVKVRDLHRISIRKVAQEIRGGHCEGGICRPNMLWTVVTIL